MASLDKTSTIALLLHAAAVFLSCAHAQNSEDATNSSFPIVNSIEDVQFNISLPSPNGLQIYALPVGQGDCTIIQCPNGDIVVLDCGSSGGKGLRMTPNQVTAFLGGGLQRVVAIVITHADRDHFNYLNQIPWNMPNIRAVIIGGVLQDYTKDAGILAWLTSFGQRLNLVNNGNACIGATCIVPVGTDFCANQNIKFDILAANNGASLNEKSIVLKASTSNGWNMLLPGDIEGPVATTIARTIGTGLRSTVYKMAHHGASSMANQPPWLAQILPLSAFASSGYNFGRCKHPRCETIGRLRILGSISLVQPHHLYCGNGGTTVPPSKGVRVVDDIYETTPCSDVICTLTYRSTGEFFQDCRQILEVPPDDVEDTECQEDDEESMNGNGSTTIAGYVVLLVVATLCAVVL